ncbi:MAG: hypothetical protein R2783_09700 [Gelidibacter sp.]
MKKMFLLLVVCLCGFQGHSQTNQTTVNYKLSLSILGQVGGDLVIVDNPCPEKNPNKQVLFEAISHGTVFFEIKNNNGGNSCVTLTVETVSGTTKTDISADSQSGVLKFIKVKKAYLSIARRPNDRSIETATSSGSATIWF